MSDLRDAAGLIERQLTSTKARCVIVDDGVPSESNLLGTRDGFLCLAKALLQFVADVDDGHIRVEAGYAIDDRIKAVMYQLPTHSAWIAACCMLEDHESLIAHLRKTIDPQLGYHLTNDPQFAE